jgi:hypothetical protein
LNKPFRGRSRVRIATRTRVRIATVRLLTYGIRTYVLLYDYFIPSGAAPRERVAPGSLVPVARGRLRRRLGGRPGRAPSPQAGTCRCTRSTSGRGRAARASVLVPTAHTTKGMDACQPTQNDYWPPLGAATMSKETGGVLLSQALAGQVPSALRGLTALFGMGRGVSPSPRPPENRERPRRSFKTTQRHNEYHFKHAYA